MHHDIQTQSWTWTCHNSGVFTFQNCQDMVRHKFSNWPFSPLAWFPNHSPKMSTCLIRALHGKRLTKHFLMGIGIRQEENCLLCMAAAETIDHLFFQCPFSGYIWQLCRLKLGLHSPMGTLHEKLNFCFCNSNTKAQQVFWQISVFSSHLANLEGEKLTRIPTYQ